MGWRDGSTIPLDYRNQPAPAFGEDARLDALAHVVCEHGGHIPHHHPSVPSEACEFHRRTAAAYLAYIDSHAAALDGPRPPWAALNHRWLARHDVLLHADGVSWHCDAEGCDEPS